MATLTVLSASALLHCTAVVSASPMATLTVLSASAVRSRTSGMAISSALRVRSGITSLTKGWISSGSLTSLHMVSITMAALRCMITLPRTRRPRSRMGTITESVALSTLLTYVVATRRSRQLSLSVSGFRLAEMTASRTGITSGLSITCTHDLSAARAVSLICGFGSCETSMSARTTLGRLKVTAFVFAEASDANRRTAASFVCQRCSWNWTKSSSSERVSLAPLVQVVVLVDVAGLRARDPVERGDGGASQAGERAEDGALLLRHLGALQLVNHFVRLLDGLIGQLLRGVLAPEGLQLAVRHLGVDLHRRRRCSRCGRLLLL